MWITDVGNRGNEREGKGRWIRGEIAAVAPEVHESHGFMPKNGVGNLCTGAVNIREPAPGALTLLGVAGVLGSRKRR